MNYKLGLKFIFLAACLAFLAACSTTTVDEGVAAGQQTAAVEAPEAATIAPPAPVASAPSEVTNEVYYFGFDQDVVAPEDIKKIKAQAIYLVAHPDAKIRLEGNTDQRGSREYNIALGWRRAKTVSKLLQLQGVAPSQIDMVSYGEEKPVALGHDEGSYRLNRRVNLEYQVK
jgi:peptidoglycan-associated lipoprotein